MQALSSELRSHDLFCLCASIIILIGAVKATYTQYFLPTICRVWLTLFMYGSTAGIFFNLIGCGECAIFLIFFIIVKLTPEINSRWWLAEPDLTSCHFTASSITWGQTLCIADKGQPEMMPLYTSFEWALGIG